MRPYRLGGVYDRPIARRLAEDAGIPRGTFARRKIAVSALLHRDGRTGFAPATLRAIEQFAGAEADSLEFQLPFRTRRRHRALVKVATRLDVERLVQGLERRRRVAVHFDRRTGTLLFRWAVSVVGRRYLADVDSAADRSLS